jgi:hypothetical protein
MFFRENADFRSGLSPLTGARRRETFAAPKNRNRMAGHFRPTFSGGATSHRPRRENRSQRPLDAFPGILATVANVENGHPANGRNEQASSYQRIRSEMHRVAVT